MHRVILFFICLWWSLIQSVSAESSKIIIGGKNFTESHILTRSLTMLLQKEGFVVEERLNLLTKNLRRDLLDQQIHIYWEYTGTAYRALLRQSDIRLSNHPDKLFNKVRQLDEKNGVLWLNRSSLNNTFMLVVKRSLAEKHNLWRLSDLGRVLEEAPTLVFGMHRSFSVRPDGFGRIASYYGFKVPKEIRIMGHSAIYGSLLRDQINVGMGFGTDPQIQQFDLVVLEDNQAFFPVYNAAPTLLQSTADRFPGLVEIANRVGPLIDQATMIRLNYLVDIKELPLEQVVAEWLRDHNLL